MFTYVDYFILKTMNEEAQIYFSFLKTEELQDCELAKEILHNDEEAYFKTLKYKRKINSFLLGRYAAKKAASAQLGTKDLSKILIKNGIFGQPIVCCNSNRNIQVSITHCDDIGAAVAFPEIFPMGIDIEKIDSEREKILESQLTQHEKELAYNLPYSYNCFLTMVWTAKESLSKILKTGLTISSNILEVDRIETRNGYPIGYFSEFVQYNTIFFILKNYICSITYPKNAEIIIDIHRITESLYNIV